MIKNFVPAERKTAVSYSIVFDDGHNNGFAFPCDEHGKVSLMNEYAEANYNRCLTTPEKFVRFNKLVKEEQRYTEPAQGDCDCGEHISLYNEYMGACQCPKCGQWYNLFGQKLLPPQKWGDV